MTKFVVIIGFCVAFAAGLTVGLSRHRPHVESDPPAPAAPTTRHTHRSGGFLVSELNLTPQQQEQMKEIWSKTARGGRSEQDQRRQELREQRDAAIEALIPAQDKPKFEAAMNDYRAQLDAMDNESRDRFRKSVEETKKILTPEQRTKYEEFLARQWGRDRDNGRDNNRSSTRRSDPPAN